MKQAFVTKQGEAMLTEDQILELLNTLQEHKMAKDIFVPVLKKMGLKGVKFTGGPDEEGIDIEYYQLTEPDNIKSYVGIQFKKGDLVYGAGGTKNTVKEIKNQAEEAFEKEIHDIEGEATTFISRFIAATTGDINEKARKYIGKARQKNKDRQISYWSGTLLVEYIKNYWMEDFLEYFHDQIESEDAVDHEELAIVDAEYIQDNYSKLIEQINKVSSIVNGFEWEILQSVGLLGFRQSSWPEMVDLLLKLEQTEDYCSDEFRHLCSLGLLEIDEDGVSLSGAASSISQLYDAIAEELEDAEEDPSEAEDIYDEII